MRSALIAGHLCVDLIPALTHFPVLEPGELVEIGPLTLQPGGCVSNTAGTLASFGVLVQGVGDVGDDELGHTLIRMLAGRGMRTDQIRPAPGRSTSYSLVLDPPGADRSFWHHVGANAAFDGNHLEFRHSDLLHLGYPPLLPALVANGGEPLEALLLRARAAGVTTSLDLAVLDPGSAAAEQDWPALLARVLPLVDVLSPSVDDLRSTLGWNVGADAVDLQRAASRLVEWGAGIVMLTAGPAGLVLVSAGPQRLADAGAVFAHDPRRQAQWSNQKYHVAASAVTMRTTLGAGDAATAGLLGGLLTDSDPLDSLRLASRVAAERVSGRSVSAG